MITEHKLIEGAFLYTSAFGNLLVGCPPEILKVIISQNLPMPDTIVIPETLKRFHSSQANLEFPFYHFLFVQRGPERGKKFRILAKQSVCSALENLLRITLFGPHEKEIMEVEKNLGIPERLEQKKIKQILAEIEFLYLKKDGKTIPLSNMVEFIPFEKGDEYLLYPTGNKNTDVLVNRNAGDWFIVQSGAKKFDARIDVTKPQYPVYKITGKKVTKKEKKSKDEVNLRVLGASSGFDPIHPANGYLFNLYGKWVAWDCPAFFQSHLEKIDLTMDEIDAVFISHVHEDHLDPVEALSPNKKTAIYASPEIYHSFLIKIQAVLQCSYDEAQEYFEYHPVYAGQSFDLFGATAEVFYSVHALPALGLKLSIPNESGQDYRIFISGDHLPMRALARIENAGLFGKERLQEINNFINKNESYDLIFVDSGGGQIHGDAKDYKDSSFPIFHMHTSGPLPKLPKSQKLLKSGEFFDFSKLRK